MGFNVSKQVLVICLGSLFIHPSWADHQIESPFVIQVPKSLSYGDSPLLQSNYEIKKTEVIDNFSMDSKYPTWAEDIQLNLDLTLSPLQPWNFGEKQNFKTATLKANVLIGNTKTEFTETRESGGTSITLDFKAQCKNIPLNLNDSKALLSGELIVRNLGSRIALELVNSKTDWGKDAWTVGSFSCTGIKGFEKLAKKEILAYLKNPHNLQDLIHDELKKEVQQLEKRINQQIFKNFEIFQGKNNFNIQLKAQNLSQSSQADPFRFIGPANFNFRGLSLKEKTKDELSFSSEPPLSPHQGASLILPLQLIPPLIEKLFANGNFVESWSSSDLEGFSEFMESTTQRKYAWPEMLKYNSKSVFKFQAHLTQSPKVTAIGNNGERVDVWFDSKIVIQMFAPHNGSYVPYTEWTSPIKAHLSLQVYQGGLWYKLMSDSQFDWSAKIVNQYIKKFKPADTEIDAKKIGETVVESLTKKQYRWAIPDWTLSDKLTYRAVKMFRTETLLWIYWDPI